MRSKTITHDFYRRLEPQKNTRGNIQAQVSGTQQLGSDMHSTIMCIGGAAKGPSAIDDECTGLFACIDGAAKSPQPCHMIVQPPVSVARALTPFCQYLLTPDEVYQADTC